MSVTMIKECPRHGMVEHVLQTNGSWKCKECRKDAVIDKRRRNKIKLVEYKGGKCEICGYDKCIEALEFHHLNPNEKEFGLSCGDTVNFEKLKLEADKCIMVCANCHRELHAKEMEKKLKERDEKKIESEINYFLSNKINKKRRSKKMIKSCLNIDLIKKDILNGISKKKMAEKYSVGLTTLKRFIAKNGIKYDETNNKKLSNLGKEDFIKSFKELKTFTKIGQKYGVSSKAIQKWCQRNNLPWKKKDLVDFVNSEF